MKFLIAGGSLDPHRPGCVVLGVYEGHRLAPHTRGLDAAARRAIEDILQRGDLEGALGTTLLLHDVRGVPAQRVLLVGLGEEARFGESRYRTALAAMIDTLRTTGAADAVIGLHELPVNSRDLAWKIEHAVLAIAEGMYRFDKLKSKPIEGGRALQSVTFIVPEAAATAEAESAAARGAGIAEGITLARDLGNMPGNLCTPAYLADRARELGTLHGWDVTVLEQGDIEQLGMGGFLAVARGSRQPPRLIVMEHHGGARDAQPVVLVGKGITFDTGGISIKPASQLDEMKFDMCGAASVFGALHAAALMKLPLDIVGIVPATENMPDGNAIKPGDVVTTMSGQTVEILDTDAEGRLVLCDALTYAQRYRPAVVIDVATLTGEIVSALGEVATGLFASDDALAREIIDAGERAWDRAWQMPLWDEYQDALESSFADLPNIGSRTDCVVVSACFLSRFTRSYPWVHLDIAGTASKSGPHKGATGRPVALLAHFLARRARPL